MDILGTVANCCQLAHKCVEIIIEAQNWPEQLQKITRRITRLEPLVMGLMSHLQRQRTPILAGLQREQKDHLENVIRETKDLCTGTHRVLEECWSRKIGQSGLEFREWWLGGIFRIIYQKYGSMAADLRALEENLERNYQDLKLYVDLLGRDVLHTVAENQMRLLETIHASKETERDSLQLQRDEETLKRRHDSLEREVAQLMEQLIAPSVDSAATAPASQGGQLTGAIGSVGPYHYQSVSATLRQPTPESRPTRTDYKILFTDTNGNRSVVSEFMVKILGAATKSNAGDWRLEKVDSAAFLVKNNCDCLSEMHAINVLTLMYGLAPPGDGILQRRTEWQALYGAMRHYIPPKSAAEIYSQAYNFRWRGISRDMFRTYDFIIVFSRTMRNNLRRIRNALVTTYGQDILARDKGRIVHLGQYLPSGGDTKDIKEPQKGPYGLPSREEWDRKVLELEFAIKGFLAAELGWKQPQI